RRLYCSMAVLFNRRRFLRGCAGAGVFFVLWSVALVSGEDAFPPSPAKTWWPPQLGEYEQELAQGTSEYESNRCLALIEPGKVYDLPELIDIAERSHPQTRVAWERARQAARAVGLSESAYYPYLAASAGVAFQHILLVLFDVFPGNVAAENATLDVKWLLFDFGGRKATVAAAKEQLMMADVNFNATHQQIVFAVTKGFYDFNTARQKVEVSESALQAARTVSEAAQARFDHGLATKPDVLQAEQQTAQAAYDLVAARGDLSDTQVTLMESLGVLPTLQIRVADVAEKRFEENPEEPLEDLIDRALSQRPDLVAKLANLRARQEDVRLARSAYYPKISLEGNAGWSKLDVNGYDSTYVGNSKPDYGIGLAIDLPIFEGFARANKLRIAKSELREAESELTDTRDQAVSQVWQAYTDLKTALRKQESAETLRSAAQSAFDAALEAYQHGLGTYVDTQNAQHNLTSARSTVVDTRSAIFTAAAALALSVGDLARPAPHPKHQP
ncbi:MAG TPA: TolC family protein, partial [Candidatus Acidoferrales bacterium]|nr:TolC family protein [Candidatus Acidoferrales bacterium]